MRCCMRSIRLLVASVFALIACGIFCPAGFGQVDTAAQSMQISSDQVATWVQADPRGEQNVIYIDSPLTIELGHTKISANQGVIWLTPIKGALEQDQKAEIAVLGDVKLEQAEATRMGGELYITVDVRGAIRLKADKRAVDNRSDTDLYRHANSLRPALVQVTTTQPGDWMLPLTAEVPQSQPATTQSTTRPAPPQPVSFSADRISTLHGPDGKIVITLIGNVRIFQQRIKDEALEVQADRAVLYTPLTELRQAQGGGNFATIEQAVYAAYLEGDVRIIHTPPTDRKISEQRLFANRVYYDFTTDRAVLTDAILHTLETKTQTPIIMRAHIMRQLSLGEYRGDKIQLTTSSFAIPSYSFGMNKAYIRTIDTGDPQYGTLTYYKADDLKVNLFGIPFFYFPQASGSFTEHGSMLRDIETKSSSRFGFGIVTSFGLFETLGKIPPKGTDVVYGFDYFAKRGPAFAASGKYSGGFLTETSKEPWSFDGDFKTIFVKDHGIDDLGRGRLLVKPSQEDRGRFSLEHQHYLPDDWQVQASFNYLSDRTFLPEWYENEFNTTRPLETSIYAKHQKDNEAMTFLLSGQLNHFVTTSDLLQERLEVERLPEVSYHRIGDSILGDNFTLISDNTLSGLVYKRDTSPLSAYGFRPGGGPGLPSIGFTGTTGREIARGDFRQEIDYPLSLGQFKIVPYGLLRYTAYSDSPGGSFKDRLFAAVGMRVTTAFWKVDDTVDNFLFDLHRLRHVIEPTLNVFTSTQTTDRRDLFIFDEPIDAINNISAMQIGLEQRWQTKRGGVDRWRSVDVFALNIQGNFFSNRPPNDQLAPTAFRGLFFSSLPETSVPRNSINADFTWRISDSTAVLADAQYNIDKKTLATASVGLAVQRDQRLGYFVGARYIKELNSNIITIAANYELTPKYNLTAQQSFDFGQDRSIGTSIALIRHFDRFFAAVTIRIDEVSKERSVGFNIWPEGLGLGVSSDRLHSVFGP